MPRLRPLPILRALCLAVMALAILPTAAPVFAQTAAADPQTAPAAASPPPDAQTPAPIDYNVWNALASLAEAAIDDPNTTDQALNDLRTEISAMRTQFMTAETSLQGRIDALRAQITALGPVPTDGQTEAADVTQRRDELNAQLAEREAPLRAADEAYARADAIVRAIDRELRARQANALMTLGPSPINPANWLDALDALIGSALTINGEIYNAWLDPARVEEMLTDLPITIGSLLLAALLLLRGRRWMEHLTVRLLKSTAILRGRAVAAFFVSLSQLIVPFLGLLLLAVAIQLTRMTGPTILGINDALVPAGMALFGARWLSLHLFPVVNDSRAALNLSDDDRRRARGVSLALGLLAGLQELYVPFIAPQVQPATAQAVLMYPLIVLVSLSLWRLSRLLLRHQPRRAEVDRVEVDTSPFFDRMVRFTSRILTLLAVLAPLLGAAGYMAAAQQIAFPALSSLALIGVVIVLHGLVGAVYAAILGDEERAAQGLVPSLAGLVLALLAMPPMALIWGARETDLIEVWNRFSEGVSLGGTRIAPANVLLFFIVFAVGYLITRGLQGALGTSVLPKTSMEKGAQKAVVSGVGYLGITAAALIAFSMAGIDLSGLAIVAGALSVGIGFGLQNIVSNFVSGIILLIERPVSEGDWVEVGTTSGTIERISVRSTVIETFDRSKVIVPNADLISGAVTNYTKSSKTGRVVLTVGVAYGTDTRKVARILQEIAESEPLVVMDPKPGVDFLGFGPDALDFRIRAVLRDVNYKVAVATEMNHKIAARFAEEGIEIPFAQRDIWLRNPEALAPPAPREAAPAPKHPEPRADRDTADSAAVSPDQRDDDFREETR